MRRWIVRLSVLAVLIAAVVALRLTVFAPKPLEVRVSEVARGRVEATVTNTRAGTVRARRRSQLSPEIGGRVVGLDFLEGDRVEEGVVIVRLDDTAHRARLELAQRAFETAEARHSERCVLAERAQRELERYQRAGSEIVSSDQIDQLASNLDAAEAGCATAAALVEQARAEVAVAEAENEKTGLRAPFAGVLAELSVELGEYVTPSPPGLPIPSVVDLIDTGSIYVSAPMDEVDSAAVSAGQPARVTLDPFPGRAFEGRVVRVAPYVLDVEAQNRTVEIEVELADRDFAAGLLPGTSADVEVILEVREDVVRISTATLLEGGRVLLLEEDLLVERAVTVGLKNWDWTEVPEGLAGGEQVVTSLGDVDVVAGARAVIEER